MKIAVYHGLPDGGAKRSIDALCSLLGQRHLLTFYTTPPKTLKGRFLSDFDALFIQRHFQKRLASTIDKSHHDVCLVSHDSILQSPWLLRYLKTPTVFLCQEPTRAYYESFLRIDGRLPLPNRLYELVNRALRNKFESENARFATRIAANSIYSVESIFRSYGVISKNIYLGVSPDKFFPLDKKRENQVMIVGNDEPQKAIRFAIDVLAKIARSVRPKLLIVSPRRYNAAPLQEYAKTRQVKVEIVNGCEQNMVNEYYNQSLLTLAIAYLEPFGLSVIESLAATTPVVAVNEAGFRETMIKGAGLLLERDVNLFALEVTKLLSDKVGLRNMGRIGRAHVRKSFPWQRSVAKLELLLTYAQKS